VNFFTRDRCPRLFTLREREREKERERERERERRRERKLKIADYRYC